MTIEHPMFPPAIPSRRAMLKSALAAAVAAPVVALPAAAALTPPAMESALSGLATNLAGQSEQDAGLLRLVDRCLKADRYRNRLLQIDHGDYEARETANPMPDVLRVRPEDNDLGLPDPDWQNDVTRRMKRGPRPRISSADYSDHRWIGNLREAQWPVFDWIEPPEGKDFYYCGGHLVVEYVDPSPAARARADEIVKAYKEWQSRKRDPDEEARDRRSMASYERLSKLQYKIEATPARTLAGVLAKVRAAAAARAAGDYDRSGEAYDILTDSIVQDIERLSTGAHHG